MHPFGADQTHSSGRVTARWLTRRHFLLRLGWAPTPIGHWCPFPALRPLAPGGVYALRSRAHTLPEPSGWSGR
eukprot:18720-Pleurochrysis_carterae.AAC.1